MWSQITGLFSGASNQDKLDPQAQINAHNAILKKFVEHPERLIPDSEGKLRPKGEIDKKVETIIDTWLNSKGELDVEKATTEVINALPTNPKIAEKFQNIVKDLLVKQKIKPTNPNLFIAPTSNFVQTYDAFMTKFCNSPHATYGKVREGKVNDAMTEILTKCIDRFGEINIKKFEQKIDNSKIDETLKVKAKAIAEALSKPVLSNSSASTVTGFDNNQYTLEQQEAFEIFMKSFVPPEHANKVSIQKVAGTANTDVARAFLNALHADGTLDQDKFLGNISHIKKDLRDKAAQLVLSHSKLSTSHSASSTSSSSQSTQTTSRTSGGLPLPQDVKAASQRIRAENKAKTTSELKKVEDSYTSLLPELLAYQIEGLLQFKEQTLASLPEKERLTYETAYKAVTTSMNKQLSNALRGVKIAIKEAESNPRYNFSVIKAKYHELQSTGFLLAPQDILEEIGAENDPKMAKAVDVFYEKVEENSLRNFGGKEKFNLEG